MSRWQELVDNLLTDLETETPGADGFRVNIDHKIWEVEQKVSKTAPITLYETTVRRLHGFQHELIDTLSKQLKNDSFAKVLEDIRKVQIFKYRITHCMSGTKGRSGGAREGSGPKPKPKSDVVDALSLKPRGHPVGVPGDRAIGKAPQHIIRTPSRFERSQQGSPKSPAYARRGIMPSRRNSICRPWV